MKKIFLFGIALLMVGQLHADQALKLITVSADGTESGYLLTNVQRIVFDDNTMTVNMKNAPDVTNVVCLRFEYGTVAIPNTKAENTVFVFPNPVKTKLTITGAEVNSTANLYNLNGALLKSIIIRDGGTDIDVSSLQQGTYLLQVGKQTVKFIKQ